MKNSLILISILIFFSCEKERNINPYFAEVYPQILEEIDIECNEGVSFYYISGMINGNNFCVYEDQVDDGFRFLVNTSYITSSPEFSTEEEPSNIMKSPFILFGDANEHHQEYFAIAFPNFQLEREVYNFLDSLIQIREHDVMGKEDVVVPEGSSIQLQALIEAGAGFRHNFLINLNSYDQTENVGFTFTISTIFGNQDGSYFRFNEAYKIKEPDGTYYYMDVSFEFNLYHWPQYGYDGLWGEIREGRLVVKVKI